ncbi:InlB B-repeat-containing protein [Ruminococcus sp.]|uniref:InlB B-repeat-containing protein n=1 Tax=Ruminococcus sp. TaxID=41978 RepID=UPI0025D9DB2C|nr:InlB B-repeat-containing protein [Ruminococcus sp.]
MKKRILSILLTLCMTLCLTPISVFAEEVGAGGSAAIQLGTDALSVLSKNVNTATAPTVYFGQNHENNPAAWRVIGYDGSGVTSSQGDITLLAAGAMGVIPFVDTILNNEYAPSNLKTAIDALAAKLTTEENAAVKKRALTSGSYNGENTDCVAGGQVDNAVFWPLSTAEAFAVNNDLRALEPAHPNWVTTAWWLRSPGSNKYHLAVVTSDGSVQYSGHTILIFNNHRTVRPAFKLNMNSVLFASAAVGGKPDGGLTPIPEYSGNEWKLTLLDSRRNFAVTEKTVSAAPDDTVTLNYKGATTGKNEYISVILADNNGAQYYGRVAQPTAESGTVEIKIPSDIAPGDYTMKVFSEQYNGDCKTDLASAFADVTLTVESQPDEQFTLASGGRYYFDLSAMNIPRTVNSNLPDSTLHYVPFTYVGTVNAYKLTSETATTNEYAQQNKYAHSLFVADYAVTHKVNWNNLDTASLIFGKDYVAGGVDYTLRAPSVGSNYTGSGNSERGVPQSNEWDTMLNKDSGYIQNWNGMYSWGQDAFSGGASYRAIRGYNSARIWVSINAAYSSPDVGFRPVLEVLNADTLGPDGLKVVTLDLNGGKLGGSSEDIQIIVKNGSTFTAPASDGLTRPDGDTGRYFKWLGSDGKLYAPGDNVPADVTKLTAQFALSEQFSLKPGDTYYFDLSAMNIPGTANGGNSVGAASLPDTSLHYVPFTYVGTIEAYKLTSEMATTEEYAQREKYPHSLFVADYAVTLKVNWNNLDTASLIFGKNYASGGVDYTLRAPSVGSDFTGSDDSQRGEPQSNEWDTMLNKNSGYIQNWNKMYSWGQDTFSGNASGRAVRGYLSARFWSYNYATTSTPNLGFRPVLEVLNADTLGSDGMKVVTLDLNGGNLGGSSDAIHIIVKNGSAFTAPASDGLTRPDGNTGSYFMWLDGNGKSYEPGDSVPADVTELTVQWTAPTYAVTLNTNGGTINNGNVTEYTYGVGATLPTDVTRTGYTFKGWYYNENLTGSPVTAIGDTETGNKEYWAKWEINQYTVTVKPENGKADITITQDYGTPITAPADPTREGYTFKGWDKEIPKTMPAENMTVKAQWEINQYTISFDTNGGSEIAPITQDYGTKITAPADPTRKGYTFKGWDKEIPKTMPAENMTVKAQWEINRYTITFDTAGGSEIAPITQDYGTNITAPANPTRKGYTFKGWDKEIPETMPAENITVKAQWEINQYTIAFDTNGGSEIAPITQDYGTEITAPADPTRKGYTFKGWDKEIPKTMPAENMTVKAQWEINRYTITFDTAGGSEIAPITQDYGTNITAPANPTRKGYTFKGWDKEIPETMPAENITVKAQWEINRYTITFDTAGGSEIAPITQDYGTNITAPADPTREGYTFIGWDKAIPTTMPAENITVTAQWKDSGKPTGEIKINENSWKAFLNNITFGLFFKDTQTVTITAADNSGEMVTVEYLLSDKELTKAEFDGMAFTAYTAPFGIDPDNEYIIYVRLTDNAGNTDYICSDGIVLDGTSPVITGIEDGKTYCAAQTVTITEKYVDTVTVNGTAVTLDATGSFTLAPADGEQKIVVTDKAGNTAEMTVTVNDGHTFGEWTSNGDGTHTRQCTADGCTEGIETDNCTDEDKNHICDICGNIISNHEDANQDHVCDLCGKVISNHEDANKDHVCDYCEKVISNHEDADKDHICDLCGKTISNHEDADKDHICDHCGKVISNHEDASKDHVCELCGKTISNHEDANKDHVCDYCEKVISNHEDANKDHVCDYCGKVITNHIGGKETCRDKAVCEVCGKSYGKLDPKNHTDLKHFPAKAATEDADGNIEYWYCSGCNKYYSDKDGTKEIAKADTVTAKLPKSPPTGDTSNLMLWIALLFVSGGVLTGVTVFDKRKRHSVK